MVRARDFVDASLYQTEEDVVQDALRHLLRARPDLRIRLAVHRYETEGLSVAKAASLAGVSWAQMKDILVEHHVQPRLGLETIEEAEEEVQTLRAYFQDPECTSSPTPRRSPTSRVLASSMSYGNFTARWRSQPKCITRFRSA